MLQKEEILTGLPQFEVKFDELAIAEAKNV